MSPFHLYVHSSLLDLVSDMQKNHITALILVIHIQKLAFCILCNLKIIKIISKYSLYSHSCNKLGMDLLKKFLHLAGIWLEFVLAGICVTCILSSMIVACFYMSPTYPNLMYLMNLYGVLIVTQYKTNTSHHLRI